MTQDAADPLAVAVVTGHHPFDVPNFHRLCRQIPGVDAYPQDLCEFSADVGAARADYDVVVFYNMHRDTPGSEESWWARDVRGALGRLGETDQGIVLLHHALLAFPGWPKWSDIVGIEHRSFKYFIDELVHVHVADAGHPITAGLSDWHMTDETYTMTEPGPDGHVLLTVEHPHSMKAVAWTRQHGKARVFCFQCGHDNQAWANPSFRTVLGRGIGWAAGKL